MWPDFLLCRQRENSPGHEVPRQATGGQASTLLVKSPSDALVAVAPSSHNRAASQQEAEGVFNTGCEIQTAW